MWMAAAMLGGGSLMAQQPAPVQPAATGALAAAQGDGFRHAGWDDRGTGGCGGDRQGGGGSAAGGCGYGDEFADWKEVCDDDRY